MIDPRLGQGIRLKDRVVDQPDPAADIDPLAERRRLVHDRHEACVGVVRMEGDGTAGASLDSQRHATCGTADLAA